MISANSVWEMIQSKMKLNSFKVKIIQDKPEYLVARLDLKSKTLDSIQLVIESSNLPKKVKVEFTGSSPLVTRPDVISLHRLCSQSAGLLDKFIQDALDDVPLNAIGRIVKASKSLILNGNHVSINFRTQFNNDMREGGFNYNKKYSSVEGLIKEINKVLKQKDLFLAEPISSSWLVQESGTIISELGISSEPTSKVYSALVIDFQKGMDDKIVAKVYIS